MECWFAYYDYRCLNELSSIGCMRNFFLWSISSFSVNRSIQWFMMHNLFVHFLFSFCTTFCFRIMFRKTRCSLSFMRVSHASCLSTMLRHIWKAFLWLIVRSFGYLVLSSIDFDVYSIVFVRIDKKYQTLETLVSSAIQKNNPLRFVFSTLSSVPVWISRWNAVAHVSEYIYTS